MEPVTRKEHFLARIAGKPHDESLFPITREEFFLNDIATNGGGGGDGSSLIETTETVLLPPTTLTFSYYPEGSGTNPGDFVPEYVYATSPGIDMSTLSLHFNPHGGQVIGDDEKAEAAISVGSDFIGNPDADWFVELQPLASGTPASDVPASDVSHSETQGATEEDVNTTDLVSLRISYHGGYKEQYLGEHTVSVVLYAVEASFPTYLWPATRAASPTITSR